MCEEKSVLDRMLEEDPELAELVREEEAKLAAEEKLGKQDE